MGDQTFNSVSTNTLSTAQILVSTVYARTVSTQRVLADTLQGDGSAITNLNWLGISGTIPQGKYQPYSIPWMAMEQIGSLNLRQGTWLHGGLISPSSLSVITTTETSSLYGNYMMIRQGEMSSLRASVVSSIAVSTNTLDVKTNFFREQYGDIQTVTSSFVKYLCTNRFEANTLDVQTFTAMNAAFSSLSVGTWTVDVLQTNRLLFYDYATTLYSYFTLSNSTFYIGDKWLMDGVVYTSSLVSTTSNINFRMDVLSNFLNPHPALSAMSTVVGSSFQTLQTTASTLSTAVGDGCNYAIAFTSNTSTGIQSNFVSMCNWTNLTISNVSTTIVNRLSNDEVTTDNRFITTSNYFQNQTDILRVGISSSAQNVSSSVLALSTVSGTNLSNFSVITNSNFQTLYASVSSVGTLMASGISTTWSNTSTVSGNNQTAALLALSQAAISLSTTSFSNLSTLQLGLSTTASNLSVLTFVSLSSLGCAISTLSTSIGIDNSTIKFGLSTVASNLSTVSGSNFSALQLSISSFSTVTGSNFSALRLSVSTTGSTFSTLISFNMSTLQAALSSYSTIAGSNISSLYVGHSSLAGILSTGFSTLSSQIQSTNNNLISTVAGLGTFQYVSTASLRSTVEGLGTAQYVSTASLRSTVQGLGTAGYVSSLTFNSSLASTVAGLGTANYVSTLSLTSTVAGLGTASYVSTASLQSTVANLGTAGYISSASLLSSLTSTVAGLGTANYVSTASLQSTVANLGTAGYISSASLLSSLTSTVAGLGTANYVSTASLLSTIDNLGQLGFVSAATLISSLEGLGDLGYISSAQFLSSCSSFTNSISNLSSFVKGLKYNYAGALLFLNQSQSAGAPYPLQNVEVSTFTHSTITTIGANSSNLITTFISDTPVGTFIPSGPWVFNIWCKASDSNMGLFVDLYTSNVNNGTSNGLFSMSSNVQSVRTVRGYVLLELTCDLTVLDTGDRVMALFYGVNSNASSKTIEFYTQGNSYSHIMTPIEEYFPASWFQSTTSGITTYISTFMSTSIGSIPYQYTGTTLYLNKSSQVSTSGALQTFQTRGPNQTSTFTIAGSTSNVFLMSFQSDFEVPNYIPEGMWDVNLFANTTATGSNLQIYTTVYNSNSGVSSFITSSSNVPTPIPQTTSLTYTALKFLYTDLNPGDSILVSFYANNTQATSANVTMLFENDNYSYLYTTFGTIYPSYQVQSTVTGLGSAGYISSTQLFSSLTGLGSLNYVSTLSLRSTVQGLGSVNYVSTASLQSTVQGLGSANYVSTASLTSTMESIGTRFISTASLLSTVGGLASIGYVSSTQLVSTTSSILYYVSTFTSAAIANIPYQYSGETVYLNYSVPSGPYGTLQNFTTTAGLQQSTFTLTATTSNQYLMAFKSDFAVPTVIPGGIWDLNLFNQTNDANGNVSMWYNIVTSNAGTSNILGTTSSVTLRSSNVEQQGKMSAEIPFSTVTVGTSIYIFIYANSAASASRTLTLYFEDGSYSHLHTTFGSLLSESVLTSTVQGLGTLGYISSLSLRSTVQGLGSSGYVSSFSLASTVQGLGSALYISSASLQSSLQSTVQGLGSVLYVSSASLQSTVAGLGTSLYVSTASLQSSLQSTVQGLGSVNYVSSFSLQSTVVGLGQLYMSTPPLIFSTISSIISTGLFQTLSTQAFFYSSVNGIAYGARIAQYQTFTF